MGSLNQNQPFQNKVALITGASSGIGAATAIHLAKLGYSLSLCGRNQAGLERTSAECLKANPGFSITDILMVIGDLSTEDGCQNAVSKTIERFQRLDLLVANAGIFSIASVETIQMEEFDRVMNINVRSVVYLFNLCVPHLIATKGNIVTVSSIAGLRAFPHVLAYAMSKAALDQLTRCAAIELAPKGVRVNSVNPGVVDTPIYSGAGMSERACARVLEKAKTTHAMGRPGTPEEVAQSIAFLASDNQASFITGVTLSVDGGRYVMCPN